MKSIYKIIFSSLILMGLMTSCFDKFLEEDVYDFLSPNNFYKTEADAEAAVNAIYSRLVSSEDNDISPSRINDRRIPSGMFIRSNLDCALSARIRILYLDS